MWPWKARGSSATRKKLTAFLDEGSEIDGKYTFTGTVLLNGKFLVRSPLRHPHHRRARVVNATVRAGTLVVNGSWWQRARERAGGAHGQGSRLRDLESPVIVLNEA